MDSSLQDILNTLEELISNSKMEQDRITRELAVLENRREDDFERLSREGNDEHLRRRLEEADEKITLLKKKREGIRRRAARKIQEFRQSAERLRDEKIAELKSKYEKIAEERDALRDEVIPELEQELQELRDNKKNLDSQLLTITSEINDLSRFTIEVPALE